MSRAGAQVSVVQRFHTDATVTRDGIAYQFVVDRDAPWLSATAAPAPFVEAVSAGAADLIHINGLIFPQLVAAIRRVARPATAIVAQHHGGEFPIRAPGLLGAWQRRQWRNGLAAANALSFTAATQAQAWRDAGVIGSQSILELIEASTELRPSPRDRARQGQFEELAHAVAVVVVLDVLDPVHQRQARVALRACLVEVVGVDLLLASVDFNHRRDQRDHVIADVLDERRLFDDQPVGELDQHLGTAGLRRVHAAHEVIDRLRGLDERLCLRVGGLARIGQCRELIAILLERLDRRFIGNGQRNNVASFFRRADLPVPRAAKTSRAARSSGQCPWRTSARRAGRRTGPGTSMAWAPCRRREGDRPAPW